MHRRFADPAVVLVGLALIAGPAVAAPEPCRWNGARIQCPEAPEGSEGTRALSFVDSLAATEPAELYADPFALSERIATPGARERFRRGMERLKGRIERARLAVEWRRRHGRIDHDAYRAWFGTYRRAIGVYREGVWFYKSLGWLSSDGGETAESG